MDKIAYYKEKCETKETVDELSPISPRRSVTKPKVNKARAVGIKSTLYYQGKVIMSTYDNNTMTNTIIEKEIQNDQVHDCYTPGCYTVSSVSSKIEAKNNAYQHTQTSVDNPVNKRKPGEDLIHSKDLLEKKYFGKTFDDNIHIQIAYNILDIEKILAHHINTIVFALNNVVCLPANQDFVGNLDSAISFSDFKNNPKYKTKYEKFLRYYSSNDRLLTFPFVFGERKNAILRSREDIYAILTLVSQWRQYLFHPRTVKNLYSPDSYWTQRQKSIVYGIYEKHLDEFNKGFYKSNQHIIAYLTTILDIKSKPAANKFANRFYEFAARRQYLHMGISIEKIRGHLSKKKVSDRRYDICKKYLLYEYYLTHDDERKKLVGRLRNASCDDEKKESIYKEEAKRLKQNDLFSKMGTITIEKAMDVYESKECVQSQILETFVELHEETIAYEKSINSDFVISLYFISLFLSQKERRIFLLDLRYKFESIAGFLKVLRSQGEKVRFETKYSIFCSSRILPKLDSAICLARNVKEYEQKKLIDLMTDFSFVSRALNNGDCTKTIDKPHRNFIKKHILSSGYGSYLSRYANGQIVYNIVHNPVFLRFVLGGMKSDQLEKYCSLYGQSFSNDSERKNFLLKEIPLYNMEKLIEDINILSDRDSIKSRKKVIEKSKLYFCIPYLFIRNLLNVNARYFMAHYALERDHNLFFLCDLKDDYCKLAKERPSEKALKSFPVNLDNYAIRIFRNQVVHLNIIHSLNDKEVHKMDFGRIQTYFELYHYLLQSQMSRCYKKTSKTKEAEVTKEKLKEVKNKYHTYSKNLTKMVCYPFSYNLSRYRNLSENVFFDVRNHVGFDMRRYRDCQQHANQTEAT